MKYLRMLGMGLITALLGTALAGAQEIAAQEENSNAKKAAPKAKRAAGVARGSTKKKIRHQAQGQRKR